VLEDLPEAFRPEAENIWKTWVADAAGKDPHRRSPAEQAALTALRLEADGKRKLH
jgi:hypothetical protein